jgi:SPP1 family predicted phage head-tail adaptor
MRLDYTVTLQTKVVSVDAEGLRLETWTNSGTIKAGVQPANMSQVQLAEWGLSDLQADARTMYFEKSATVWNGQRAIVEGVTFEVRALNTWPKHKEAVIVPVQGV